MGLLIGLTVAGTWYLLLWWGSQPSGYSAVEYFFLWSTEPTNLTVFACLILMMLWFPNGQLPSRRWRILYIWLFLALAVLYSSLFVPGPEWNGGADAGGIVIDNPYGWLPENAVLYYLGFPSFISLLLILMLAAISLISRYRSAGQHGAFAITLVCRGRLLYCHPVVCSPSSDGIITRSVQLWIRYIFLSSLGKPM